MPPEGIDTAGIAAGSISAEDTGGCGERWRREDRGLRGDVRLGGWGDLDRRLLSDRRGLERRLLLRRSSHVLRPPPPPPPRSLVDRSRDRERLRSRLRDLDRDRGLHDLLLAVPPPDEDFLTAVADRCGLESAGIDGTLATTAGMTGFGLPLVEDDSGGGWASVLLVVVVTEAEDGLGVLPGGSGFDCRYDLVSKVTKSLSTKPFVSCCKKTSSWSHMAPRNSDSGFSFLANAKTYLAKAAGSASHLKKQKFSQQIISNLKCFG